eukprot:8914943-Ditylum_brightwellii.AAC.1
MATSTTDCAQFSNQLTQLHKTAVKQIGTYLLGTSKEGMILNPKLLDILDINCFVGLDFAGLCGTKDPNDPTSAHNRTGFIIYVAACPVIWSSKLQSEIAMSTMHAEYVVLSSAMKEILQFQWLLREEDNSSVLTFANWELIRVTPKSKHYRFKVYWFQSKLGGPEKGNIRVKKIVLSKNLYKIMTKGLRKEGLNQPLQKSKLAMKME